MLEENKWVFRRADKQFSLEKWQKTINLMTELFSAPAGFIVHKTDNVYRIIVSSEQQENPYEAGAELNADDNIFCKKVVRDMAPLYVDHASKDSQWDDSPLVKDGFESYLGVPISWPNGEPFGTFCVMDFKQTHYQQSFLELIEQLRDMVEDDLALLDNFTQMREIAMLDSLTNIYNRRALSLLAQQKINLARRLGFDVCCLFIDINDFKKINDEYGHKLGDEVLITISKLIKSSVRKHDSVFRVGGDEFMIVLVSEEHDIVDGVITRLTEELNVFNQSKTYPFDLSFSAGIGVYDEDEYQDIGKFFEHLDFLMYDQKRVYKEGLNT